MESCSLVDRVTQHRKPPWAAERYIPVLEALDAIGGNNANPAKSAAVEGPELEIYAFGSHRASQPEPPHPGLLLRRKRLGTGLGLQFFHRPGQQQDRQQNQWNYSPDSIHLKRILKA